MRLSNVRQIVAEDFPEEDRELITRLGGVLNYFMRQVVELANDNIDFENLTWDIVTVDLIVDSDGVPINNTRFSSSKGLPRGLMVVSVQNRTNSANFVSATPFVQFTYQGNNLTKIDKVLGLNADEEYRLTVVVL